MKVHNALENGFQEVIYQRGLAIRIGSVRYSIRSGNGTTYLLDGIAIGLRRADFIIEKKLVVEINAVIKLEDVHLNQAKNYTVAYNFPFGLLINFGSNSLEYKRIFNNRKKV
ncbi:MAG: GxxExxY protein [Saprospiraceae bacterium]|nr:GxxExxY protein [Saprospiraceae bacterium]